MDISDAKDCPYCEDSERVAFYGSGAFGVQVGCGTCGLRSPTVDGHAQAVHFWNKLFFESTK
jgi:hypothetical protein